MSSKQFAWLSFVMIGLTFLTGFMYASQAQYFKDAGMEAFMQMDVLTIRNIGPIVLPIPNAAFFTGLFSVLSWNYPWFEGDWVYVRWFFSGLTALGMWGVLSTLTPLISAAAASAVGLVRAFIPGG